MALEILGRIVIPDLIGYVLVGCLLVYAVFAFCLYMIIKFGSDEMSGTAAKIRDSESHNPFSNLNPSTDLSSRVVVNLSAGNILPQESGYRIFPRWYDFVHRIHRGEQSITESLAFDD